MAEYFSHDYTARHDTKIRRLIAKHGMAGYGLFWAIVEDLYMNGNELPCDYEVMAFDLRASVDICKSVCEDFDLFVIQNGTLRSESVGKRLMQRTDKSDKARESAAKRWGKDANAMRTHSERNAMAMRTQCDGNAIKESKEKKEKKGGMGVSDFQEPRPLTINLEPNTGTPRRKNILYYSFSSVTADQFFESLSENTPTSKLCEEQAKELGIKFRTRKYLVPHIKEVFKNWMVSGRLEWLTPERFAEVTPKNMPQFMHLPGLTVDEPNNPTA